MIQFDQYFSDGLQPPTSFGFEGVPDFYDPTPPPRNDGKVEESLWDEEG